MFKFVFLQVTLAGLNEVRLRFPSIAFRAIAFPCNKEFIDRFALSRPSFAVIENICHLIVNLPVKSFKAMGEVMLYRAHTCAE
jgi:hypothetical protein